MGRHTARHSGSNRPPSNRRRRRREPTPVVEHVTAPEVSGVSSEPTEAPVARTRKRKRRTVKIGPLKFNVPTASQRELVRWGLYGVGIFAVLFVVTFGLMVWRVYYDMTSVRNNIRTAEAAMLAGDMSTANEATTNGADAASEARKLANSFVWVAPANLPVVGTPLQTVRHLVNSVAIVAEKVVPKAFTAVSSMSRPDFRRSDGGVNLAVLEAAAPDAIEAADQANAARWETSKISRVEWLPFFNDTIDKAKSDIIQMTTMVEHLRKAAQVLPTVLGRDGPRTYLLIYQTNAEARGTGGFVGGAGLLRAENGSVHVDHFGTNVSLRGDFPPLDLGPDFMGLYSQFGATGNWYNSNMSPHFPDAARTWQYLWEMKTGMRVDGVIAVDPFALSRILAVTGPLPLPDGGIINAANVVPVTEKTSYERFADDQEGRKAFLTSIAEVAAEAVTTKTNSTFGAVRALSMSIGEARVSAWSSHPEEQTIIATTPIGHTVPYDRTPYASVVVNNGGGNKLDYYLSRSISYTGETCQKSGERTTTVTMRLTNNVPVGQLPSYAIGTVFGGRDPYVNRSIVTFYGTAFAQVKSVKVNGVDAQYQLGSELGHPVVLSTVDTAPGIPSEIVYELVEPNSQGAPRVPIQPLVQPVQTTISLKACN
ncbi:DUF4012 domain-containing protein [Smaragdicoccus niigatensis]|uniref:DUF4012 domain-containing protein n=1 Tax=Smaragdicoccus niigatensis TaxID=359359 RepID=UPI0003808098|nr:DUF4012 domain-containing protein [Smaragdicoccus niigatensis]